MSETTKPHHFGSGRVMTEEEKTFRDSHLVRTDNSKVIADLQTKNDALVARVARLESAIRYSSDYLDLNGLNEIGSGSKAHRKMKDALKETKPESLAEIKAAAVKEYLEGQLRSVKLRGHLDGGESHD